MLRTAGWMIAFCLLTFSLDGGVAAAADVSGRVVLQGEHGMLDISINERDRVLIREYYGQPRQSKGLPPGLAKKGKLPPGIQKQLVRQQQLPASVEYRYLPRELERRLTRVPDGYARVVIGGSLALINERTRVVFDVMHGFD